MRWVCFPQRRRRRALGVALSIGLLASISVASAAPYQFSSADGGYSVTFPSLPEEQITNEGNARTVLNALNHDNAYYAVVHVDHAFAPNTDDELDDNITKFSKQIGAPTQLRRKKKFTKGPREQLPAEEFTFESPQLVGKGIVVVEGQRTYMAVAFATKPHDHKSAVDRFVASFKFKTPAKPKEKSPAPAEKVKSKQ